MKIEQFKNPIDTILLTLILALMGIGLVSLLSASYWVADGKFGDHYYFFYKQLRHAAYGILIILILHRIPYQIWVKYSFYIMAISGVSLILVLIPQLSITANGAGRWLKYVYIQPSEMAKVAVVFYLAKYLSKKGELARTFFHGFVPSLILAAIFCLLIVKEKDLGGAIILASIVFTLMFVSGQKIKFFFLLVGMAAVEIRHLITSPGFEYRMDRIRGYIDPWSDPQGYGYPIIHSLFAFANGGIFGVGPGNSIQKQFFLPEVHTDYIFSVVGEEVGFLGVVIVAILFLGLCVRGFMVSKTAKDMSGFYLAVGLTMIVVLPAFVNMGVAISLLPAKGLPLPFFSYGGSSLLASCVSMGVLLNIAGQNKKSEVNELGSTNLHKKMAFST
jgi:cell division protein FtsW